MQKPNSVKAVDGLPVRCLDCHGAGIPQHVKDSDAVVVHSPLTVKGVLLLGYPVGVIDCKLNVNDAPILPLSDLFFRNVHHGEIQHFRQVVIRRENRIGFCDLGELAIEPFDGIGRIDHSAISC